MKYTLFSHPEHDSIEWIYKEEKVKEVMCLWDDGLSYNEIALKAYLKKVEVVLILMDLAERKVLRGRDGGLYGANYMINKKKKGPIF